MYLSSARRQWAPIVFFRFPGARSQTLVKQEAATAPHARPGPDSTDSIRPRTPEAHHAAAGGPDAPGGAIGRNSLAEQELDRPGPVDPPPAGGCAPVPERTECGTMPGVGNPTDDTP